jgi:hypothetical protein
MNHVLTPFSRFFNLIELGNRIKETGAHWHLLLDEGVPPGGMPDLGFWVHEYHFPRPPEGFFIGHWMINQFLDRAPLNDEDRYMVLTDDDYLDADFFRRIDPFPEDIVLTTMKRGWDVLTPRPEHIQVGLVGFEQLVIKGRILKQYRCEGIYHADGLLIMKLWAEHPEKFRFIPEAVVYYNWLPATRP